MTWFYKFGLNKHFDLRDFTKSISAKLRIVLVFIFSVQSSQFSDFVTEFCDRCFSIIENSIALQTRSEVKQNLLLHTWNVGDVGYCCEYWTRDEVVTGVHCTMYIRNELRVLKVNKSVLYFCIYVYYQNSVYRVIN